MGVAAAIIAGVAAIAGATISAASTQSAANKVGEAEEEARGVSERIDKYRRIQHQQDTRRQAKTLEIAMSDRKDAILRARNQERRQEKLDKQNLITRNFGQLSSLLNTDEALKAKTTNVWR